MAKMKDRKPEAVNLVVPNTTEQCMAAIVETARAVRAVAEALLRSGVDVTIANNTFHGNGVNLESEWQ